MAHIAFLKKKKAHKWLKYNVPGTIKSYPRAKKVYSLIALILPQLSNQTYMEKYCFVVQNSDLHSIEFLHAAQKCKSDLFFTP